MTSFAHRLTCSFSIILAMTLPALAKPADWAIAPDDDGHTLNFFYGDVGNAEDLGLQLTCGHDAGDTVVDTSILIVSDDNNGAAAKALVDFDPFGEAAAAQFVFGTTTIPAPVWAFRLEADGMNGAWDLTIDFSDSDQTLIHKLAEATKPGPISLVVAGQTFDLTPQPSDFTAFKKFAAKC